MDLAGRGGLVEQGGQGFRVAMQILNNGRIGLGTGSVGGAKKLLDLSIEHVKERRQFGRTLTEFQADSSISRPNYRAMDNEKLALQEALDEAMRRALTGLRAVSNAG